MAGPANFAGKFQNEVVSGPSAQVSRGVWSQIPPVSMPWVTAYQNFPEVVRFTGNDCNRTFPFGSPIDRAGLDNENKTKTWFSKRKGFFENEMVPPPKLHITEEHMASQLESMHISKLYTSHSSGEDTSVSNECNRVSVLNEDGSSRDSMSRLPSLVICDELRQLQTPNILPPSLVAKLESPSKALVLWKPPSSIFQSNSCGRSLNTEKHLQDVSNHNTGTNSDDLEPESQSSCQQIGNDLTPCSMISGLGTLPGSANDVEDMSIDM